VRGFLAQAGHADQDYCRDRQGHDDHRDGDYDQPNVVQLTLHFSGEVVYWRPLSY
jgi:hypothetical protein